MNTHTRWCLLAGLLASAAIGCRDTMESVTDPSFSRVGPGASFTWTMPARFGQDRDGDGLTDYLRTPAEINPPAWTVNFDACELAGDQYIWHVNQRRVASVTSCQYAHEFATEGAYDVALHVVSASGSSAWAEQVVTVQDWLVVSFGDSYASGEGVPEVAQANEALLEAVTAALQDLVAARRHLDETAANLQDAFENKGLAESVLATQQQRLNDFLAACTIDSFKAIARCAEFLAGLPFDTYETARAHFSQGVEDARARVESLTQAFQQAQAAFTAAQNGVANIEASIAALRNGFTPVRWQAMYANEVVDRDCHRSARAAPARAALALEQSDPRTSVTFVHLACTGAQVTQFPGNLREQIPWAAALIGSREIDAVLLSIGGNDAGFANIATACVILQPCYVDLPALGDVVPEQACFLVGFLGFRDDCIALLNTPPPQSAKQILNEGLAALPGRYAELGTQLLPSLPGLLDPASVLDPVDRVRSSRVYITEYVDMTKDDTRAYCAPAPLTNPLGTLPGVSTDELSWLDVVAAASINQAGRDAAATHGWTAVGGIYAAYEPHGYCADDHWVVRLHESFIRQGDPSGLAHPNVAGHTHNGQAIFAALLPDLYPLGIGGAPRAPDQPFVPGPFTARGGPVLR
ncbi:MAG: hypothetical protein Q8Q14_05935 [Gemmatimonadales bacterium]|nr:hypothetical protein [Gemmatimonadales bacterium]